MSSERRLREKVREVLRQGRLPPRGPDGIWGGLGSGARCEVCECSIADGEIELEISFTRGEQPGRHTVHLRCFSVYEDERHNFLRIVPASASDGGTR